MPKRYCHPKTAWRRLKEFEEKGMWEKVFQGVLYKGYESGGIELESVAIDATTIEGRKGGAIGIESPRFGYRASDSSGYRSKSGK